MIGWFKQLDDLLRGRITHPDRMDDGNVDLSLRGFVILLILLGAIYGFFMGWFALFGREEPEFQQLLASTVKMPALFLLTFLVTFPSLYVFNALVGCRLSFVATLRLLVGVIVVNLAVAASFGPILGFFTLSTDSYHFMMLLNVVLLAIAGTVGLGFLLQTLRRLAFVSSRVPTPPPARPADTAPPAEGAPPPLDIPAGQGAEAQPPIVPGTATPPTPERRAEQGPMEALPSGLPESALGQSQNIFRVWVVIYGLVGAQMGWILRPFIGHPNLEFTWFREQEGNFFQAVFDALQKLFGG